jgi:hypothetical protein
VPPARYKGDYIRNGKSTSSEDEAGWDWIPVAGTHKSLDETGGKVSSPGPVGWIIAQPLNGLPGPRLESASCGTLPKVLRLMRDLLGARLQAGFCIPHLIAAHPGGRGTLPFPSAIAAPWALALFRDRRSGCITVTMAGHWAPMAAAQCAAARSVLSTSSLPWLLLSPGSPSP